MSSSKCDIHREPGVQKDVEEFVAIRAWGQFHDVKNLSLAIASEVGELCAVVRWTPAEALTVLERDQEMLAKLSAEIGDIAILLLSMCNRLGLDFETVVRAKLSKNEQSYPAEQSRGRPERPSA